MCTFEPMRRMSVFCCASLLLCAASASDKAHRVFEEGRALVEANDPDRALATAEGLLKGAVRIEEALELGYPDRYGASVLLGTVYTQVAASSWGGNRSADYVKRAREAYSAALQARPGDVAALRKLSTVQPDYASGVAALRTLLQAAPDDVDGLFRLGLELVEGEPGRNEPPERRDPKVIEEGVRLLERTAELSRGKDRETYPADAARILRRAGKVKEAEAAARHSAPHEEH